MEEGRKFPGEEDCIDVDSKDDDESTSQKKAKKRSAPSTGKIAKSEAPVKKVAACADCWEAAATEKAGKGDGSYCKINRTKGHNLQECYQVEQKGKKSLTPNLDRVNRTPTPSAIIYHLPRPPHLRPPSPDRRASARLPRPPRPRPSSPGRCASGYPPRPPRLWPPPSAVPRLRPPPSVAAAPPATFPQSSRLRPPSLHQHRSSVHLPPPPPLGPPPSATIQPPATSLRRHSAFGHLPPPPPASSHFPPGCTPREEDPPFATYCWPSSWSHYISARMFSFGEKRSSPLSSNGFKKWVQSHISFNQVHGEAQGARRLSQEADHREGAGRHGAR
ncbi:pollen-specific leucine-rich repeat extensin-like protein 1 [Triticum dicoccoides]|uniref:pollen-specific leucine-rich repeat extensin-like protein 1 n=1 Tax=Triticum dicoccoides TaxID=85692 RepID=UPI00188E4ED6|nr:pollen-specific leucine-rich repeat extensin-like protein 1 [Triticum dicoccoides]